MPREPNLVLGSLSLAENVRRLDQLRAGLELAMVLCARWVPSTPETTAKIQLGKALWHLAMAADSVARRRAELDDAPRPGAAPPPAYAAALAVAADLTSTVERLAFLHGDVASTLLGALDEHRDAARSFGDGVTEWALDPAAVRLRALGAWYENAGRAPPDESPAGREARARLRAAGGPCGWGREHDELKEGPAPAAASALQTPAREPGLQVCDPVGPRPATFLMFLHSTAFNVEICATEVCAALIAEHPEAPWGLKLDLARQIYDEVRHAESLLGRLGELGGRPGQFPIDLRVWRSFRVGETLVEKLIVQHRIGEGGGLDGGALVVRQRRHEGDERTARLFEYINADEINHVKAGNLWASALLSDDADQLGALEARVRAKLEALGLARPALPTWVEGRRRAGFDEDELASTVRAWRAQDAARTSAPGGSPERRRAAMAPRR
ncbi:MAG: ferritin-like domain-containing protein [Polyangiaceae bacterium]|nr:ferritin-like domain-containing protein [Polyangiaceae bacterium]